MHTVSHPRVGPAMLRGLASLSVQAAPSMSHLARIVGPHGSVQYGFRTVRRLIDGGLATLDASHPAAAPGSHGAVVITPAGRRAIFGRR